MEPFKKIIDKGRIDVSSTSGGIFGLVTNFLVLAGCLYAFYSLNFSKKTSDTDRPIDFYNIAFILLTLLFIYILIAFRQKLKVKFYEEDSPIERKKNRCRKSCSR